MRSTSLSIIFGDDDYLVDRRASFLVSERCSDHSSPEIFVFSGHSAEDFSKFINNVLVEIDTISLFSAEKIIWLRGVDFCSDAAYMKTDAAIESLLCFINKIKNNDHCSIFISLLKADKRLKTFKLLNDLPADIEEIKSHDKNALSLEILYDLAKKNNLTFGRETLNIFQKMVGRDARLADQEMLKLSLFLHPRTSVTADDIAKITIDSNSDDFFDQLEIFFSRDFNEISYMLERFFWQNTDGRALLYAIQNRLRLLIQIKILQLSGKLSNYFSNNELLSAQKSLNIDFSEKTSFNIFSQNPWYLSKLAQASQKTSLDKLLLCQLSCPSTVISLSENANDQKKILQNLALSLY